MPGGKKQTAITLGFSKKNLDVFNLLQDKKENEEGFNQSEYICDCIRFFEQYKDKLNNNLGRDEIMKLIDSKLEDFKNNLNLSDLQVEEVKDKFDNEKLENDIENINSGWLEDD